jgi:hypothetical protein
MCADGVVLSTPEPSTGSPSTSLERWVYGRNDDPAALPRGVVIKRHGIVLSIPPAEAPMSCLLEPGQLS